MKALIAFWRAKLKQNHWLMGREDEAMVQQTIRALQDLQKLRSSRQVEREAEIVRTVKQLDMVTKEGQQTK